jgi:hypothetical protein
LDINCANKNCRINGNGIAEAEEAAAAAEELKKEAAEEAEEDKRAARTLYAVWPM